MVISANTQDHVRRNKGVSLGAEVCEGVPEEAVLKLRSED